MSEFAAQHRDNTITAETLKHQNSALQRNVAAIAAKIKEIRTQIASTSMKRGPRIIKKKCDHAPELNGLETHLKSKENEYKAVKGDVENGLR